MQPEIVCCQLSTIAMSHSLLLSAALLVSSHPKCASITCSQFHPETKRWCKRACSDYITWQRFVLQTFAWHYYVTDRVEWHFEVSSDGWLCILIVLANATGQCFQFAAWPFWQFIEKQNCILEELQGHLTPTFFH